MKLLLASAFIMMAGVALAQHHPRHGQSPYAGMEKRLVKALDDQQVADLRAGRGIGLALAAELNGYPGPLHVLELADQLGLSPELQNRVREFYSRHAGGSDTGGGVIAMGVYSCVSSDLCSQWYCCC